MLAAIALTWILSLLVLFGSLCWLALVVLAGAMDPLGRSLWKTHRGPTLAGLAGVGVGLALVAMLVWGGPCGAPPAPPPSS